MKFFTKKKIKTFIEWEITFHSNNDHHQFFFLSTISMSFFIFFFKKKKLMMFVQSFDICFIISFHSFYFIHKFQRNDQKWCLPSLHTQTNKQRVFMHNKQNKIFLWNEPIKHTLYTHTKTRGKTFLFLFSSSLNIQNTISSYLNFAYLLWIFTIFRHYLSHFFLDFWIKLRQCCCCCW